MPKSTLNHSEAFLEAYAGDGVELVMFKSAILIRI